MNAIFLLCGLSALVFLAAISNKSLRRAIGDWLTSEGGEAKREKPWG